MKFYFIALGVGLTLGLKYCRAALKRTMGRGPCPLVPASRYAEPVLCHRFELLALF